MNINEALSNARQAATKKPSLKAYKQLRDAFNRLDSALSTGDELPLAWHLVRKVGAVDAESIRANRENLEAVNRKRAGEKGVILNEPDVLLKYEEICKIWPVNTLIIIVKRLTSTPAIWTITSKPKTATELYAEIKKIHGRREETTYEVIFRDSFKKESRGQGNLIMPSTIEEFSPPPGTSPDFAALLEWQRHLMALWQSATQATQYTQPKVVERWGVWCWATTGTFRNQGSWLTWGNPPRGDWTGTKEEAEAEAAKFSTRDDLKAEARPWVPIALQQAAPIATPMQAPPPPPGLSAGEWQGQIWALWEQLAARGAYVPISPSPKSKP
jgi:hypothetical protein